jgi:hypothetical protein
MATSIESYNRKVRAANEARKRREPIPEENTEDVASELDGRLGSELLSGSVSGIVDGVTREEAEEAGLSID